MSYGWLTATKEKEEGNMSGRVVDRCLSYKDRELRKIIYGPSIFLFIFYFFCSLTPKAITIKFRKLSKSPVNKTEIGKDKCTHSTMQNTSREIYGCYKSTLLIIGFVPESSWIGNHQTSTLR